MFEGLDTPAVSDAMDNLSLHLALERAPTGSVLVVSTGNFIAGYWGEVLTVAAQAAGVVGLIIDGGVRDMQAIEKLGFPVYARGVSVKGTVKATAPSVGQPIPFNGTQVAAGDLVVADDDGIVIILLPVITALLGFLLLGEGLQTFHWLGGALIFAGLLLATRASLR